MTEQTDKTLTLEEEKEKKRLEVQKNAAIEQLKLLQERFGEDSPEVKLLGLQIKNIEKQIGGIGKNSSSDAFTSVFRSIFKNSKLSDEDIKALEEGIVTVFNKISESLSANTLE